MKKVLTTLIGSDGILTVALGNGGADKTVRVTVETLETEPGSARPLDRESWLRFLERTGGSIADETFERAPQGDYEERDPLP